jgi:hypothetical protein
LVSVGIEHFRRSEILRDGRDAVDAVKRSQWSGLCGGTTEEEEWQRSGTGLVSRGGVVAWGGDGGVGGWAQQLQLLRDGGVKRERRGAERKREKKKK